MSKKVSCLLCKHYYNTYDRFLPRGCKLYQLKSASFPSEIVKKETGKECLSFDKKVKRGVEAYLDRNS